MFLEDERNETPMVKYASMMWIAFFLVVIIITINKIRLGKTKGLILFVPVSLYGLNAIFKGTFSFSDSRSLIEKVTD
jgi:hypothetical protein